MSRFALSLNDFARSRAIVLDKLPSSPPWDCFFKPTVLTVSSFPLTPGHAERSRETGQKGRVPALGRFAADPQSPARVRGDEVGLPLYRLQGI